MGILDFRRMRIRLGDFSQDIIEIRVASVDQIIADKMGESPVRSLELYTEGLFPNQIGCSYISYDQRGEPIPRESDPQLVFDRLFRNPMQNVSKRKELKSVLDRVIEDSRDLLRHSGVGLGGFLISIFLWFVERKKNWIVSPNKHPTSNPPLCRASCSGI